ncbi:hypothetical protein ABID22_000168 [Pontibacter aydingkolensis]
MMYFKLAAPTGTLYFILCGPAFATLYTSGIL